MSVIHVLEFVETSNVLSADKRCIAIGAVVQRVERWTLRSVGRGFKSYPRQPWASCLHLCAPVTKQHNLVPAKER